MVVESFVLLVCETKVSFSPLLRDFGEDEGVGEDAGGGRGAEDGD